ncbi:unnamed protein product [Clonostachys rosea]|uniref:Beta-xylosidase C-terminal Concanavalin A-like domain-containing protein n=1 Tax=Bionectria ochroleuca TaxID=29856 RepID=A0ABY6TZ61_BIOOC|nr:unnamed protein product [Clonostachys rosea]
MISQKLFLGLAAATLVVAVPRETANLPFTDDYSKGLYHWTKFGNGTWDSHQNLLEGRLGDTSTWLTITPNRDDYTISTTTSAINYPGVSNGIVFRASDGNKANFYSVGLHVEYVEIHVWKDGKAETLKRSAPVIRPGLEVPISVEVAGSNIKVFLPGGGDIEPLLEVNDETYDKGGVGFFIQGEGENFFAGIFRTISISDNHHDERMEL